MSTRPRFEFFEVVRVQTSTPESSLRQVNGKLGVVSGRACTDDGRWSYGVFIYDDEVCWSVWEEELVSTGSFEDPHIRSTGESVRVAVDDDGYGYLVDDQRDSN